MNMKTVTLRTPIDAATRAALTSTPALLLSASIPFRRPPDALKTPEARRENTHYVRTAEPERVQGAISHLCRALFQHDMTLVFGGHPAITPLVLDAAREFSPAGTGARVYVYQSEFFQAMIPPASFDLARWDRGVLVWTEGSSLPNEPEGPPDRDQSLARMRDLMVSHPGLVGAIFLGGMEGIPDEHARFLRAHSDLPTFAVGTTGSAAADLLKLGLGQGSGSREIRALLERSLSYPLVMQAILKDLDIENVIIRQN